MPTPISVIDTSAFANAAPMRNIRPRSLPRIPTPTHTAKTSSPSESATKVTFRIAASVTARPAGLCAQNRVQRVGEQLVHGRAQLREREGFVQERVRAGGFRARV